METAAGHSPAPIPVTPFLPLGPTRPPLLLFHSALRQLCLGFAGCRFHLHQRIAEFPLFHPPPAYTFTSTEVFN